MALQTLPDEREDEQLNPEQKHYEDTMGSGYASSGVDQLESFANDPANHSQDNTAKSLNNAETSASGAPKVGDVQDEESAPGGWKVNRSEGDGKLDSLDRPKLEKALGFAKKRGGLIGLIALFGVGGGLVASFLGPASMIINLMENASITNDSSSTVLEKRVIKALGFMTKDVDPVCAHKTNNLKCKMGRISNSALDKLVAKGVKPVFADDIDNNERKKTGYPTKNPIVYSFKIDGVDTDVPANQFAQKLRENPKMAAKVLGTGGAFNLRVTNWGGRYITQQFYNKFNLKKDGGIADGKNEKLNAQERYKAALEKYRSKIPGIGTVDNAIGKVKNKVGQHTGKAQKGGTAYMLLVAGCIGVKAPGYIAAAAAAVQLAQVMPSAMDLVLSPGSKNKISGIDTKYSVTAEDMDTVGTLFTNETPREGDGEMTSALDSQYLLASIGVNKAKPPVSVNYTPGYSVLTHPVVLATQQTANDTKEACNVILSPAAMWSAFAVDSAVTVALSSTIIGGLIKVGAGFIVGTITEQAIIQVTGEVARAALTDAVTNDKIPKAEGEALGDVTGIGLKSFFSAGAAARNIPVLKTSQVPAFQQTAKSNEEFKKEMDIASLSPFDISSRYTFLGSITRSMQLAVMTSGAYDGSFSSILSSLARLPALGLTSNVGAANYTENSCGYAEDFGLEAGPNTPAITFSGTPCYGMTDEQLAMDTDTALTIIEEAEWLDESVKLNDTTNIADMVGNPESVSNTPTYIKKDTPLSEFIQTCGDLSTGDYLYNAAGCTVNTQPAQNIGGGCFPNADGTTVCTDSEEIGGSDPTIAAASPEALTAMSVMLVDYQITQMVNGTDVGTGGATGGGAPLVGRPDGAIDAGVGWELADGVDYSQYQCEPPTTEYAASYTTKFGAIVRLCAMPNELVSAICLNSVGQQLNEYSGYNGCNLTASVIATNLVNMLTAARAAGHNVTINDGMRLVHGADYRSIHTYGTAVDLAINGYLICSDGIIDYQQGHGSLEAARSNCMATGGAQFAAYEWFNQNAVTYGLYNYGNEPWHWSSSGN